jgi:hypothetical protein
MLLPGLCVFFVYIYIFMYIYVNFLSLVALSCKCVFMHHIIQYLSDK